MNAADIDRRVKLLDQTAENPDEGEKKSKAGFWEEFDVRFLSHFFFKKSEFIFIFIQRFAKVLATIFFTQTCTI